MPKLPVANGIQSECSYLVVLDDEFDTSEVLSSSKLLISR